MGTIGIVGLFLGILTLIIVSYKGFHAVPTSLLAGLVIMTFNCINTVSYTHLTLPTT